MSLLAACTSQRNQAPGSPLASPLTTSESARAATSSPSPDPSATVWLCRPGLSDDPCTRSLSDTAFAASGAKTADAATPAVDPPIDCFYVYPTVSKQSTVNANLHIDPEETAVAVAQASRFSQVCRVYAPMYPQLTLSAIGGGARKISTQAAVTAYLGVLKAWQDYLANDNHGRGVVFIGHSQGAFLLTPLLQMAVDRVPAVRRHLVSAILLGGNVSVPKGKLVGGDFANIPACTSGTQTRCVVAYSSFDSAPPANSLFGRVGTGIGAGTGLGGTPTPGSQVLCTNPATLDGSAGLLRAYFPTTPFPGLSGQAQVPAGVATPWVSVPGEYSAACRNEGGASWLQVTRVANPADRRPAVHPTLGSRWGLHLVDVNIALGNLVTLVGKQAKAYAG